MTGQDKGDPAPPPTRYQRWLTVCIIAGVLIGLSMGIVLHDVSMGLLIGATVGCGGGMAVAECVRAKPKRNQA